MDRDSTEMNRELDHARERYHHFMHHICTDNWDHYNDFENALKRIAIIDPEGVAVYLAEGIEYHDSIMKNKKARDTDSQFFWERALTKDFLDNYHSQFGEEEALAFIEHNRWYMERVFLRSHHISEAVIASAYSCRPAAEFDRYLEMILQNEAFLTYDADCDHFNVKSVLDWFGWMTPYEDSSVNLLRKRVSQLPDIMKQEMEEYLEEKLKSYQEFMNNSVTIEIDLSHVLQMDGELIEQDDYYADEYDPDYDDLSDDADDEDKEFDEWLDEDDYEEIAELDWTEDKIENSKDDFDDFMDMTAAITAARGENPLDPSALYRTMKDPLGLFKKK